jgi:hypothetical protein
MQLMAVLREVFVEIFSVIDAAEFQYITLEEEPYPVAAYSDSVGMWGTFYLL